MSRRASAPSPSTFSALCSGSPIPGIPGGRSRVPALASPSIRDASPERFRSSRPPAAPTGPNGGAMTWASHFPGKRSWLDRPGPSRLVSSLLFRPFPAPRGAFFPLYIFMLGEFDFWSLQSVGPDFPDFPFCLSPHGAEVFCLSSSLFGLGDDPVSAFPVRFSTDLGLLPPCRTLRELSRCPILIP